MCAAIRCLVLAWVCFCSAAAQTPRSQVKNAPRRYTLTPQERERAVAWARQRHVLYFAGEGVLFAVLGLMVCVHFGARLRRWAEARSKRRFVQAAIVGVFMLLALALAQLPLDIRAEALSRFYGQSVEGWAGWFADWAKWQALTLGVGVLLLWGLYGLMRRSPGRWWIYAWLCSIPLQVAAVFLSPLAIEPLFNDFQPLMARHPELVGQIEHVLRRAGVTIPPERMFEMRASEKTNELNAYVSGFGSSKRLVLYDTIIAKEGEAPLLTTIGHELGHYVLHHVRQGMLFGIASTLVAFGIIHLAMRRWGNSVGEWDSLPMLLLAASLVAFLGTPVVNAFSRIQEHAADVYSLEVTHGIVPDPGKAAATAFQIEGESDLADPDPNGFIKFWLFSHPPLADRLRFALEYDPWGKGQTPRYVR